MLALDRCQPAPAAVATDQVKRISIQDPPLSYNVFQGKRELPWLPREIQCSSHKLENTKKSKNVGPIRRPQRQKFRFHVLKERFKTIDSNAKLYNLNFTPRSDHSKARACAIVIGALCKNPPTQNETDRGGFM